VKFLIVDDNPADRELITRHLRREFRDAVFVEVFRRQEFEEALARGDTDVVITDYQMHWTDGLWILMQCQGHLPHSPVIMITDTGGEEIAVEGMKAGLSDYLLKNHLFRLPMGVKESLEKIRLRQAHEEAQEALRQTNERLEAKVAERTRELQQLTAALQADNAARQETQAQLEALLKEKEVLFKEMHHRVKNNLQIIASLLSLQADVIQDARVRKMFEESQHRINTMALLHETLYQTGDLARIEFSAYIRTLVTQLFHAAGVSARRIALEIEADEIPLEVTTAVPCGLLVNELVTNCLKHAFPGQGSGVIWIVLRASADGNITIQVSDTGVGFPEGVDFRSTDSLGLQLVCLLTEQLSGTIALERLEGTTFTLTFPVAGRHEGQ
jgi:two-component sensor histidine kinase/FixJ family two-component response regulator